MLDRESGLRIWGPTSRKIERMWDNGYEILICISINANLVDQYHFIKMQYWKYMAEYKMYEYR
jgi:hypothetical protein